MSTWRETVMVTILAAYQAELISTFGPETKAVRELPPENVGNVTAKATGYFLELDGTKPTVSDNGKILYKVAPLSFLGLLKCAEGEGSTLPSLANDFEAMVERLLKSTFTASDGTTFNVVSGGDAYGRACGHNQMWVDVPAFVVIKGKP